MPQRLLLQDVKFPFLKSWKHSGDVCFDPSPWIPSARKPRIFKPRVNSSPTFRPTKDSGCSTSERVMVVNFSLLWLTGYSIDRPKIGCQFFSHSIPTCSGSFHKLNTDTFDKRFWHRCWKKQVWRVSGTRLMMNFDIFRPMLSICFIQDQEPVWSVPRPCLDPNLAARQVCSHNDVSTWLQGFWFASMLDPPQTEQIARHLRPSEQFFLTLVANSHALGERDKGLDHCVIDIGFSNVGEDRKRLFAVPVALGRWRLARANGMVCSGSNATAKPAFSISANNSA